MNIQDLVIQGSYGNLSAKLQMPDLFLSEKVPLVILMHGMMLNKDYPLLTTIADKLSNNGIASLRFDFNGHGKSDGDFIDMTVPKELDDAMVVYKYAITLDFVSNIGLLGHSQGGVVASMEAGELGVDRVSCVVLMSPTASYKDDTSEGMTLGHRFDPLNPPE